MLGSMVVDELARRPGIRVIATWRAAGQFTRPVSIPGVEWVSFDAASVTLDQALRTCGKPEWIINAIGITKPLILDDNSQLVERAIRINSLLPHTIARFAEVNGARVLQIATDCVYSGAQGGYVETDPHDALDVYGKSKSLGECCAPSISHLRCSIIGPEPKDFKFLIEWFRSQPAGARVNGFVNHKWNGITTLHFARICAGIVDTETQLPHLQHVVPEGVISKAEMLHEFAAAYRRNDVQVCDTHAATIIDRTLSTLNTELNRRLWAQAGYATPPTVPGMIMELGKYSYRFCSQEVA
jgi:dTDP-4-dehydrorhamnose reductase